MSYKDFQSKFNVLAEEFTSKFQQGGFLNGQFCVIRKDALKNPKILSRPSQYVDKIKSLIASKLPLKVCAVKSERPESAYDISGVGSLITNIWIDVVQEAAPGLWTEPMSLPGECLDIIEPEGQNWSPMHPEEWKYKNKEEIHGKPVKVEDTELDKQTAGSKRSLTTKHTPGLGKSAKDGRDGLKKPTEYKESLDTDNKDVVSLTEAYVSMQKE